MLHHVLNVKPNTWDQKTYTNQTYYLVEVRRHTSEFMNIEQYFDNYSIVSMSRVQNPFQYGRFVVQKEYDANFTEGRKFVPVPADKLSTALTYNCDYRKMGWNGDMFFPNVSGAVSYDNTGTIIVIRTINTSRPCEASRYPEYVVKYASRR